MRLVNFRLDSDALDALEKMKVNMAVSSTSDIVRRALVAASSMEDGEFWDKWRRGRMAIWEGREQVRLAAEKAETDRLEAERLAAEEYERTRPLTLQESFDKWLNDPMCLLESLPTLHEYWQELTADLGTKSLMPEEVGYCAAARGDIVYRASSPPRRPAVWSGPAIMQRVDGGWERVTGSADER